MRKWLLEYKNEKIPPRERNWLATALRPLESLCFRETGSIFDVEEGFRPSDFFSTNTITVLELDSLSTDDKTFFIEIILQWIRDWLIASGKREKLVGVIILEEAHHILNREKSKKFGETVMDLVFREVRELGIGIVYADQHPSLVSYPALGNTSTHVYMNLGLDTKYSSDVDDAAEMLGLSDEEKIHIRKLPVGYGIMMVRNSSFTNPFMVKFPLLPLEKGKISDGEVGKVMGCFVDRATSREKEIAMKKLGETQIKILKLIGEGKGSFTSEIYKKLRISGSTFKKNVEKLLEMDLLRFRKGKVYKQNSMFFFPTEKCEKIFSDEWERKTVDNKVEELRRIGEKEGWEIEILDDDIVKLKKNDVETFVGVVKSWDYKDFKKILERLLKNDKSCRLLASSEELKNRVIQLSARYSYENPRLNFSVYVAVMENDISWKRVEFGNL